MTIKRILAAIVLGLMVGAAVAGPAQAADNLTVVNGTYSATVRSRDIGGVHYPANLIADPTAGTLMDVLTTQPGDAAAGAVVRPIGRDRVGTAVLFDGINDAAPIPMAGMQSIGIDIAAGTFDGTIGAECSLEGGGSYLSDGNTIVAKFVDPETFVTSPTVVLTNPNAKMQRGIIPPPGASHCRAVVTAYISGSTTVTPRGTAVNTAVVLYATDGTGPVAPKLYTAAPGASEPAFAFRCIGCPGGTGGIALTDEALYTIGSSSYTPMGGRFFSTRDSMTDGQAGVIAVTAKRAVITAIETTAGNDPWNETLKSLGTHLTAIPTVGFQSAATTTTAGTACTSQDNLNFASTTRQLLVALATNELIRICSGILWADADTDIRFYDGTQTTNPCDAGTPAVMGGPYKLTSANGRAFLFAGGSQPFIGTKAVSRQLCLESSSATANVTFTYRWARY